MVFVKPIIIVNRETTVICEFVCNTRPKVVEILINYHEVSKLPS
jgi:hypothetical protein